MNTKSMALTCSKDAGTHLTMRLHSANGAVELGAHKNWESIFNVHILWSTVKVLIFINIYLRQTRTQSNQSNKKITCKIKEDFGLLINFPHMA